MLMDVRVLSVKGFGWCAATVCNRHQMASTDNSLTQKLDARERFADPPEAAALELLFRRPVPPAGPAVAV